MMGGAPLLELTLITIGAGFLAMRALDWLDAHRAARLDKRSKQ